VKKLVIGCGLAMVLAAIAATAGFYYFVYRPARTFVASMSQLGEVAELDAKVANTRPFTAPADDTLTEAQVKRFVAVQESLHARMGTRATELQTKYKALEERKEQGGRVALTDLVGAYKDLFGVIAEAKRAQVDALNAQAFSLDEYSWVKSRFYEAAGVNVTGIDFREMAGKMQNGDLQGLQDLVADAGTAARGAVAGTATSGTAADGRAKETPVVTDAPGVGIPEANKTLVAPFKEKAATWMVYGAFGL